MGRYQEGTPPPQQEEEESVASVQELALLPGGTDDLADEDPIEQIGYKLLSRRPKGEAGVESREDYEDSLYQPSGGEEEDEHEHGHGVRAAKVEEEHPWETVRCDYEAPSDLARLVFCVPLHNNRSAELMGLTSCYASPFSVQLFVVQVTEGKVSSICGSSADAQ